ncbi:MAG TPA: pyruvate, phosphate dikinase [Acidimicrobiales bacterium]|nr:pyruvate, phosphate dikinase [Acidimicrobiales bacterium]
MTWIYGFAHPHATPPRDLKDLLGGKGANLAEMTSVLGLPVPPGFTITTEACVAYLAEGWPDGLDAEIAEHVAALEEAMGRQFGDPDDPLLLSVRSGAKFSMPGMMDTILNLGLNDESAAGLAEVTGHRWFALDSYRRLIQMYGTTVAGVDGEVFDHVDGLDEERLATEVEGFGRAYEGAVGSPFPQEPERQLREAVEAVFRSWNTPRADAYRRREGIPDDLGTAVNVQVMVFGNRDDRSGTGVGFTRDPATGAPGLYGDFLVNAQGEDVVAGIRNTLPLTELGEHFPDLAGELQEIFDLLEQHYRDMMDIEFTIEQDKLWILQTRVGKRTGAAAVRLAVAMNQDEHIALSPAEAVDRVLPEHIDQLLHPQLADFPPEDLLTTGLGASPGAGVGRVYFTADACVAAVEAGERAVLVRHETSPEDIHGMAAAEGVLTARGGLVSHAAVVARQWGKPAVVGAQEIEVRESSMEVGGVTLEEGDYLSIDGTTGDVVRGEVATTEGKLPDELTTVLTWADEIRAERLGVRANADTGADAARARAWGAEGIGLCRTEHQFLGDRLPLVRRMILAETDEDEVAALEELGAQQRVDFEGLLEAMDGLPVTVRLLDPPLHEFLPDLDELIAGEARDELDAEEVELLAAGRKWREQNPMLGVRGVRLAVLREGLYRTQVRALLDAAEARTKAGGTPIVEVMIPLVVVREELALARSWVEEELAARPEGATGTVRIGTMIETPRACVRAHEIAEVADFFSFGTNDLTQLTFGFSRDDVEGPLMTAYLERGLLAADPFSTVDQGGVADLIRLGVEGGRRTHPGLKVGVCGEHGGDPASIAVFLSLGVDYVSCSPFRVPIARLAAARAVLDEATTPAH